MASKTWFEELWIGDLIRRESDGAVGKFEGLTDDDLVRFKYEGQIHLEALSAFAQMLHNEKPSQPKGTKSGKVKKFVRREREAVEPKIDLHLTPEDERQLDNWPGSELHYQITKCEKFIAKALKAKLRDIEIIHGKGDGILRAEVLELLGSHPEVISWRILHAGATSARLDV